jgi:hypothetical protein
MAQRFLLDPPGRTVYFALILLGGCRSDPALVVPVDATPVSMEQVQSWVAATAPRGHSIYQFKWLFRNDRSSAGGVGRARVAAPDTLRFDARGPLGSGRMAAVVIGDEKLWAVPEDQVAQFVPDYPLLWAMFGVARYPGRGAELRGIQNGEMTAWQYADGSDTVAYVISRGNPARFHAEVRRGGKLFGKVDTRLSAAGRPMSARLTVPGVPAQLDIQFVSISADSAFPPETWSPPEP